MNNRGSGRTLGCLLIPVLSFRPGSSIEGFTKFQRHVQHLGIGHAYKAALPRSEVGAIDSPPASAAIVHIEIARAVCRCKPSVWQQHRMMQNMVRARKQTARNWLSDKFACHIHVLHVCNTNGTNSTCAVRQEQIRERPEHARTWQI